MAPPENLITKETVEKKWHKVADVSELGVGRVKTVTVGKKSLALSNVDGKFGAIDNSCPHQGGPLGEGSIENGWLRCPWHGYDFDPLTGNPPGGFSDSISCFKTKTENNEIYVELPVDQPYQRTASDLIVETLVAWGVDTFFGMVGHSNLGIADAIRRAAERGEAQYIGIRHEGAASFAASAYGKLTGKPAACLGIAGPGSTNMLTGLYDAKVDRAPLIAISGQVPTKVKDRGAFQDLDLVAAFGDAPVYSATINVNSDYEELASLAVKNAIDLRGVSHLVILDDTQTQVLPNDKPTKGPEGRIADREVSPPENELTTATEMILEAKRPVFVLGNGARGATKEILQFAEKLNAPILTTFKAKGIIADNHRLAAGVLGRSGTPVASWFMNESDLLIVVGASFSNHTGIADYKPTIQIDDDHTQIGRFHAITCGLLGDGARTIKILDEKINQEELICENQTEDIASRWKIWRAEKEKRISDDFGKGLGLAAVFDALTKTCPKDAVICVDVGNNAYAFGRYFESSGQHILMSGYLGSIGFGFPAAMGAWAAKTSRPIVAVTGDGGFGQYLGELTTAVHNEMSITHILLDNAMLAKISKEQRAGKFEVWKTELLNPDFAQYAKLCGAQSQSVTKPDELEDAFKKAFASKKVNVVSVACDADLV